MFAGLFFLREGGGVEGRGEREYEGYEGGGGGVGEEGVFG